MRVSDPHSRPAADCLADLEARLAGLTTSEAEERLAAHGPNRLPEASRGGHFCGFWPSSTTC